MQPPRDAWARCKNPINLAWTCPSYRFLFIKTTHGFLSKSGGTLNFLKGDHHSPIIQWPFLPIQVSTILKHTDTTSTSMAHSLPTKIRTKASPGLAICCYLGQHCKPNRFTNKISKNITEYQKISFQYVGLCWFQLMTPSTINHQPLTINH